MNTGISIADKKLVISRLIPFYRDLLTENQREMASLFADEDLSLAEISEQYHVSRQSVHDTIAKAEKQMSELEQKLGLCSRYEATTAVLAECSMRLGQLMRDASLAEQKDALGDVRALIDDLLRKEDF